MNYSNTQLISARLQQFHQISSQIQQLTNELQQLLQQLPQQLPVTSYGNVQPSMHSGFPTPVIQTGNTYMPRQ